MDFFNQKWDNLLKDSMSFMSFVYVHVFTIVITIYNPIINA